MSWTKLHTTYLVSPARRHIGFATEEAPGSITYRGNDGDLIPGFRSVEELIEYLEGVRMSAIRP